MAKRSNSPNTGHEILVSLTQDYIDRCVTKHIECLERLIRDDNAPPADGSIERIINAIDLLRTRVIAANDPAGRGIGAEDEFDG